MPTSGDQDISSENASGESSSSESISGENTSGEKSLSGGSSPMEQLARTAECPSCGRRFVGDYCPDCGQEADPTPSVTGVIGGFFRELVDMERGLLPTLVGLTIRPATLLQRYLSGVRSDLMSPGRYLLASVVISFVTTKSLAGLGLGRYPGSSVGQSAGEPQSAVESAIVEIGQYAQSEWFAIAIALLITGLLSLLLLRLFSGALSSVAEALATSAFLIGHATMLGTGLQLVLVPLVFLRGDGPASVGLQRSIALSITVVYVGIAAYGLGQGWKGAVKGIAGTALVYVESVALVGLGTVGYVLWRAGAESIVFGPGTGFYYLIYLVPFLLHAAVELYYRFR